MLEPAPFKTRSLSKRERKFYQQRLRILSAHRWREIMIASGCLLLASAGLAWVISFSESWTLRIVFGSLILILNWFVLRDMRVDIFYLRRFLKTRNLEQCQELHVRAETLWEYGASFDSSGFNAFQTNAGVLVMDSYLFSGTRCRASKEFRILVFPDGYVRVFPQGEELKPEREFAGYLELPRGAQVVYHFTGSLEELHQQFAKPYEYLERK